MSRSAALDSRKGEQKAAIAIKKAEHEADLAMGLTTAMAKIIRDDELLCTMCGATKLGPIAKCECPGGRSKPGPGYCCKLQLLTAAKSRSSLSKAADMKDQAKRQDEVAASRSKKKVGGAVDVEAEFQGEGNELQVVAQFPVGKLGMSMEKNGVSDVTGDPARELGVKKGWVLMAVGGEAAPADKVGITKLVMSIFKEQKIGLVDFKFRVPIMDGFSHCIQCDKFVDTKEFDEAQLEKGPGKQMCAGCEEIAAMGF